METGLSDEEVYNKLREVLFQSAAALKELVAKRGIDVGEIRDCAPIVQFACIKCNSATVAVYIFSGMVALSCMECGMMEVVGVQGGAR